jgi:hypothetical protein
MIEIFFDTDVIKHGRGTAQERHEFRHLDGAKAPDAAATAAHN